MSGKMSSDSHFGIPIIELPTNSKDLDGGSDEWRSLCKSVREACENHGCFQAVISFLSTRASDSKMPPVEMEELSHVIGLTIIDGYGLGEKREWLMKDYQLRQVMKYSAPPSGEYTNVESAHTDKLCSALLCEDGISGLEIETKDGEWVKLCMPPGTIIKAAKEMVDEEHPRVFKDTDFMDFVDYANAGGSLLFDSEAVLICCSTQKLS
ncbi:hypothetical protein Gogos_021683 [Gossypium gossypioides]|uniref:Non-haem dioxygenase N-terminal domain-containing protein n=1 Tax=Gossypium gossypioides TaxID=34282 RepID=A0A7J9D3S9_GOSGO|nr:hypothetical protein [Gossypium gossypioides]